MWYYIETGVGYKKVPGGKKATIQYVCGIPHGLVDGSWEPVSWFETKEEKVAQSKSYLKDYRNWKRSLEKARVS